MTRICIAALLLALAGCATAPALLLALAGCATAPAQPREPSPCALSEASYDCQVERYNNVNVE